MRRGNRPRGVFITGTDTGVGKTVVAGALAAWCRSRRIDVGIMKPVATGGRIMRVDGARRFVSDDARDLAQLAGVEDPWSLTNPVCFKEPLAPLTASLRARTPIRLRSVRAAFRALCARHEFLIVEGVGGLLVPLTERLTVAHLAQQLGLPLLIVARARLGTLNHTLLSLQCAKQFHLSVRGVVVNHVDPPPTDVMERVTQRTTPDILRRVARAPILGELPFYLDARGDRVATTALADWFARHLGEQALERLVRYS